MKTQDFGWIRISLKNSAGDSGNWPSARGTSEMSHAAPRHSDEPLALRKLQWHFPAAYASFLAPGKNGQVHPHLSTHRPDNSSTKFKTDVCPLQLLFLEARCAEVMSIGLVIYFAFCFRDVDKEWGSKSLLPLNQLTEGVLVHFMSWGQMKIMCCVWQLFSMLLLPSRHIDVSRGWLFISWQGEGRVWGQMRTEAGNSQFSHL